jgi:hypothetical protein
MLIDEIVDILGHENGSLTNALMKTKILLHKLGHKELVEWVNNELNGYSDEGAIPSYRIVPSQVLANVNNGRWRLTSHPIPIGHLEPEEQKSLTTSKTAASLAELEALSSVSTGESLQRPIPMEVCSILDRGLDNYFRVERAWCSISLYSIKGILVNVRSSLLDFLLELREQIGEGATDSNMKEKSDSIDTKGIFANAIFGSNTTIIVGNQNTQTVSFNAKNIADLQEFLRRLRNQLPELNILEEARKAAGEQIASVETQLAMSYPDVGIVKAAGDVLYGILLGVGGNLATELLKHFASF